MITTGDKIPSFGLAADGKPANVPSGHMHVEMDTSKVYFYDEKNDTWYEDTSSSGGGGSSLPAVTAEDNGDVLTVVDGAWGKAAPGGGGQFIITVTPNDEETELSVDKTYQEIATAFAEGKTFYFYYPLYSTPFAAYYVVEDDGTYSIEGVYISLEAVSEDTAEIGVLKIYVTADSESGIVAYSEHSFVSGTYSSIPPMN